MAPPDKIKKAASPDPATAGPDPNAITLQPNAPTTPPPVTDVPPPVIPTNPATNPSPVPALVNDAAGQAETQPLLAQQKTSPFWAALGARVEQPAPGQMATEATVKGTPSTPSKIAAIARLAGGIGDALAQGFGSPAQKEANLQSQKLGLERQMLPLQIGQLQENIRYRQALERGVAQRPEIAAANAASRERIAEGTQAARKDVAGINAGTKGYTAAEGPSGVMTALPNPRTLQQQDAKLALEQAQTDAAKAQADYNTNPQNARLKQQHEEAQARLAQAWAVAQMNFGLRREGLDIQRQGLETKQGAQAIKYYEPALKADERLRIMKDSIEHPNAQNDVAMLFNHMGMTLSAQTGARMTNAEISRAIKTRTVPQGVLAELAGMGITPQMLGLASQQYDSNTYVPGGFLSPQQRKQMFDLGVTVRNGEWNKSRRNAAMAGLEYEPAPDETLPPVGVQNQSFTPQARPGVTPSRVAPPSGGGQPTHIVKDANGNRIGTVVNGAYVPDKKK